MKKQETAQRNRRRLQTDKIVKYVLSKHLTCEHDNMHDCNRCLARWIREALAKFA